MSKHTSGLEWHGGKGSITRKSTISEKESDLRWELIKKGTSPERKKVILELLREINKE